MPNLTDDNLRDPLKHVAANFLTPLGQHQLLKANSSIRDVMNVGVRRRGIANLEKSFSDELSKLTAAIRQLGLVEVEMIDAKRRLIDHLTEVSGNLQMGWNGYGIFQKSAELELFREKLRRLVKLVEVLAKGDKAEAKQVVAQYADDTGTEAAIEKNSSIQALMLALHQLTHSPVTKLAVALSGLVQTIFIGGEYLACEDSAILADCFEQSPGFVAAVAGAGTFCAGTMLFANQFFYSREYAKPVEDLTVDEQLSRDADIFSYSLD
ncbi:hypothetical protein AVI51_12175 [Piscirickettsia salmonis]|uniref:Uncharacterized protein n=1 Tax=Piscirickettsia salmonis TaxID=1238 RepID=A0A9Q5VKC4_PISSA|nr:hypothetical protein [Piscirickettsia salmonis]ALA26230.1 bifunctional pyrimidine regulatory protein PyrR uracil phosphoribosyltransferase [Piscirickettsia salmonis]APS43668.1 hypothetical protein AVI48_04300 [Piscirickettsia salmonis]APS47023.1 hypothetical protein AVI49_04910 [Piscirickettsia salmonis]APS51529.1 hypothetical protein AVI50_12290 [Piscirickettsia salmonis]APS54742.1 hypothetical protein AVI51_12175 [Piscirickettsia salmonis]